MNEGNVKTIVSVNLCRIPFAEAVGADSLVAQIVTDNGKLLLHSSGRKRKHQCITRNAVAQAIILNILIDYQGNSENTLFPCFLFCDSKAIPSPIVHDITKAKLHNVADAQAKVSLKHKSGCYALVRTETASALFHRCDDFSILLCRESGCLFVHYRPPKEKKVRILGREKFTFCATL